MAVTANLIGRLGNQLHIMASTIGVAFAHDDTPLFPEDWPYRERFSIPDRFFGPPKDVVQAASAHALGGLPPSKAEYLHNISLWWDSQGVIKEWFQPRTPFATDSRVAVHVRRDDYHTIGPQFYVPLYETDYYERAMELCKGLEDNFLIYTDDFEYCKSRWIWPIDIAHPREDWFDLFRMSHHRKHIIANSSYSWWAAFLSVWDDTPICPKHWFGPILEAQGWTPDDFIPEVWVRI